jgi:hypothetical protein
VVDHRALATILASVSHELTQSTISGQSFFSCTFQPCMSHTAPSSSCTNHFSWSPSSSGSVLIEKSMSGKVQPHPHNTSLILTNIEKLSSLKIQFPNNTWSPFPSCYTSSGPPLVPTVFSNSHLDPNQSSSNSTKHVSSFSSTSTCLVASPSIYHLSAKPPHHFSCSQPRKRFHPYTNLAHSKKHKLNVTTPSSISEVDEVSYSPQNVTLIAGVGGFNLPPPP